MSENEKNIWDDEDELRRMILEAEDNEIWQIEEAEEDEEDLSDEAGNINPMLKAGLFAAMGQGFNTPTVVGNNDLPIKNQNNQTEDRPMPNPETKQTKIIGRKKMYSAHVFDVYKLDVELPNGKVRNYDLVTHAPAVVIVPVTDDGQILFVEQFRMGAEDTILELPAGILEGDGGSEDALEGARRECREETGYDASDITRIGGFYMTPGYCTEYIHVFLARGLKKSPLPQDEDEFLRTVPLTIEEAYRRAETGEMNDVKTIGALMFAQRAIRS